jgi:hypothetical protein
LPNLPSKGKVEANSSWMMTRSIIIRVIVRRFIGRKTLIRGVKLRRKYFSSKVLWASTVRETDIGSPRSRISASMVAFIPFACAGQMLEFLTRDGTLWRKRVTSLRYIFLLDDIFGLV